ncbi:response regulator [Paraburkholderia lycopersici]|uniref:response regulator n=1 Tax=Paraburkholderia lycopersici TaxID=416944 RepID=UPI000B853168|nr:response regulator [Paraburkholderia lycopersici]
MATVLLVDDDRRLLDALAALAEEEGYVVQKAFDGCQALRCARAERPALIVTDNMMPGMSGEELVRALANDPALADVPVVMSSAVAAPPSSLPVVAFIRKPFAAARFLELLRQHTAGSK